MLAEPAAGARRLLARPELDGQRLDVGLAALAGLPRRRARAVIDRGGVWLNSKPCRVASRTLRLGDVVDVLGLPGRPSAPCLPPLGILHEDGWLLAVDKPAGIHTQPPRGETAALSLVELATLHLSLRDGHREELKLVHRLDRMTSGVLVLARHRQASQALARTWAAGKAIKRYLAVVRGSPAGDFLVDAPIGADPLAPGRFRVDRRGRPARTEVTALAHAGGLALVEARPLTGRTHQVRVHLAERGHPVLGDRLYGGGGGPPGPFLHAWRLALPHPRDRRPLELEAPLPGDLAAFLAAHGLADGLTRI